MHIREQLPRPGKKLHRLLGVQQRLSAGKGQVGQPLAAGCKPVQLPPPILHLGAELLVILLVGIKAEKAIPVAPEGKQHRLGPLTLAAGFAGGRVPPPHQACSAAAHLHPFLGQAAAQRLCFGPVGVLPGKGQTELLHVPGKLLVHIQVDAGIVPHLRRAHMGQGLAGDGFQHGDDPPMVCVSSLCKLF